LRGSLRVPTCVEGLSACPELRVEHLPEAGHFVQHDAAAQVNGLLVDFLTR